MYQILLMDKVKKNMTEVEIFTETNSFHNLKNRLYDLQLGFCEDEIPDVFVTTMKNNEGRFEVAVAESNSDFCHISPLLKLPFIK